jgi:hypothetical protein
VEEALESLDVRGLRVGKRPNRLARKKNPHIDPAQSAGERHTVSHRRFAKP